MLGVNIGPITAVQIGRGDPVAYADLKPGDLIFFDWKNSRGVQDETVDHVGIYIGNGDFIDEAGDNTNPNMLNDPSQNIKVRNLSDNWGGSYGIVKTNIKDMRRIIRDNGAIKNN